MKVKRGTLGEKIAQGIVLLMAPLFRTFFFLFLTGVLCAFLSPTLVPIILTNPLLNGGILALLMGGIVYGIIRGISIIRTGKWLALKGDNVDLYTFRRIKDIPRPLLPLCGFFSLGANLPPLTLDKAKTAVEAALWEQRELMRYVIGVLVFLGLLGTFWGLSQTILALTKTMTNLSQGNTPQHFVETLKYALKSPLSGMGTAFGSSLVGVAGALILGFIELQLATLQRQFLLQLETWFISFSSQHAKRESFSPPLYQDTLPQHTVDALIGVRQAMETSSEHQEQFRKFLVEFAEKMTLLADQSKTEQVLMMKLAEGQVELRSALQNTVQHHDTLSQLLMTHFGNLNGTCQAILKEFSQEKSRVQKEIQQSTQFLARVLEARLSKKAASPTTLDPTTQNLNQPGVVKSDKKS